jgi:hypothetical protein
MIPSNALRLQKKTDGKVGTWISRADVADFMLKQVEHTEYLRQAPAISN